VSSWAFVSPLSSRMRWWLPALAALEGTACLLVLGLGAALGELPGGLELSYAREFGLRGLHEELGRVATVAGVLLLVGAAGRAWLGMLNPSRSWPRAGSGRTSRAGSAPGPG
jgi:hypothetical protein